VLSAGQHGGGHHLRITHLCFRSIRATSVASSPPQARVGMVCFERGAASRGPPYPHHLSVLPRNPALCSHISASGESWNGMSLMGGDASGSLHGLLITSPTHSRGALRGIRYPRGTAWIPRLSKPIANRFTLAGQHPLVDGRLLQHSDQDRYGGFTLRMYTWFIVKQPRKLSRRNGHHPTLGCRELSREFVILCCWTILLMWLCGI
jgi:hypothetical protein